MQKHEFIRLLKQWGWIPLNRSRGGRRGHGAHETYENTSTGKRRGFSIHTTREIGLPLLKDLCKRFDIPFEEAFPNMTGNPPGFKELSLYTEASDTLGRLIYESRRRKDIARSTLAKLVASDVVTVSAWENNEKIPEDKILVQLAQYFQWSEDDMRMIKNVGQQLTAVWLDVSGKEPAESVQMIVVSDPPGKAEPVAASPNTRSKTEDIDVNKIRYRDVEKFLRLRMQQLQTLSRRVEEWASREESLKAEVSALRASNAELDAENTRLKVDARDQRQALIELRETETRLKSEVAEGNQKLLQAQATVTEVGPRQVIALTDEEKVQIAEWRRKAIAYDNLQRAGLA